MRPIQVFATLAALVLSLPASSQPLALEQGWTAQEVDQWHEATQGSRLVPLAWLLALEQPGAEYLFLEEAHMERFGYLPGTASSGLRLPLGFALDRQDDTALDRTRLRWRAGQGPQETWVGMNCAACHTGQIAYRGRTMQIEGGPGMSDFQTFIRTLNVALSQTLSDIDKWDRFAARVLAPGKGNTPHNRSLLRGAVAQLVEWQGMQLRMNDTPLRYGPGRLDAFGHIYNKVAIVANAQQPTLNPADAPVSYPFLWNIHQLGHVQYNAIAANLPLRSPLTGATFDVGALGRNIGEVIGVFADVVATRDPGAFSGYTSSVDIRGLVAMEQQLMHLQPPRWPIEVFGNPDLAAVQQGAALFAQNCASCHLPVSDLRTPIPERNNFFNAKSAGGKPNTPPGTDIWMACNAYAASTATGVMEGLPMGYIPLKPALGPVANLSAMLATTVGAVVLADKGTVAGAAAGTFLSGDLPLHVVPPPPPENRFLVFATREPRGLMRERCEQDESPILGYKSRPLTGIWATPPYLHNGSVPTLFDMLLAPADRPAQFLVGTREFDPKNVGYVTSPAPGNDFQFVARDAQGQAVPGNDNAGHDYGNAKLTDEQRRVIVEYLKTL